MEHSSRFTGLCYSLGVSGGRLPGMTNMPRMGIFVFCCQMLKPKMLEVLSMNCTVAMLMLEPPSPILSPSSCQGHFLSMLLLSLSLSSSLLSQVLLSRTLDLGLLRRGRHAAY